MVLTVGKGLCRTQTGPVSCLGVTQLSSLQDSMHRGRKLQMTASNARLTEDVIDISIPSFEDEQRNLLRQR
jgi:hypothetical protein